MKITCPSVCAAFFAWAALMPAAISYAEEEALPAPKPGDRKVVQIGSGVSIAFVWVPAGRFVMGSPEEEAGRQETEGPQMTVTHTRGFWMGETPVTQAQYTILMNENPSAALGLAFPVESVSFDEALGFCEALGRLSGLNVTLPTEAQWEYACRAGTTTPFWFGGTIATTQANFHGLFPYGESEAGLFRGRPSSVRIFPPNGFGLYDMHGNVHEWCLDYYRPYPGGEVENWFQHVPLPEVTRVLRGGSWQNRPEMIRSASRLFAAEGSRSPAVGFRVVATEEEPFFQARMPMTVEELHRSRGLRD